MAVFACWLVVGGGVDGEFAHTLQKRLFTLVPTNPLMQGAKPWFPHHVLCAGAAQWACDKSADFIHQWEQALGLVNSYSVEYALIIIEE